MSAASVEPRPPEIRDPRPLLSVRDLKVHFPLRREGWFAGGPVKVVKAVDGVSLDLAEGETLGLVGESGCGKSTLGRAMLRLAPVTAGEIRYREGPQDVDLAALDGSALRPYRRRLQMIFQDPYASLNPRQTVGQIIAEPMENFGIGDRGTREARVRALMETVGLSPRYIKRYPHEFSGGQQQRIGIARALAPEPVLIVADEPISALDVSIQAQIINLIERLQAERQLTYLFVSHDLRAIRHTSDRIAVMYLGRIVEVGRAEDVYSRPLMPYTKALISAVPQPDPEVERHRARIVLSGDVPSPVDPPSGCAFHTRCPFAVPECRKHAPTLQEIASGHLAACIRISPAQPDIEHVADGATPGLE